MIAFPLRVQFCTTHLTFYTVGSIFKHRQLLTDNVNIPIHCLVRRGTCVWWQFKDFVYLSLWWLCALTYISPLINVILSLTAQQLSMPTHATYYLVGFELKVIQHLCITFLEHAIIIK